MIIRRANVEDAPAIASLAGELGYPVEPDTMRARLGPVLRSEDDAVFVGVAGMAVIGWAHVAAVRLVESEPYAELRGLVVAAALRSRGAGTRLLHAAEEWTRSRGLARIRVRSNVTRERTHAFYERHGYTATKSQKVFDRQL
ncbi:MAG TPA: GNAT family N-acetyltransferase [Thermoanaerobaculia bacterium]|nr:GNAT family N-acetyltransferase [Thermoanaerobaculia bacterium]